MLDQDPNCSIIDDLWAVATRRTKLPSEWTDYFDHQGPEPVAYDNLRKYHRFFSRGKAIIITGDLHLAAYSADISRIGMGFYAPIQLFPRQAIRAWLPEGLDYSMQVTRCMRVGESCYSLGANFLRVTTPPLIESKPSNMSSSP